MLQVLLKVITIKMYIYYSKHAYLLDQETLSMIYNKVMNPKIGDNFKSWPDFEGSGIGLCRNPILII